VLERLLLREICTAAGGTHDDFGAYDQAMAAERRAAILVTPGAGLQPVTTGLSGRDDPRPPRRSNFEEQAMSAEFRATTGDGEAAVEVRGLRKIYPGGVEAVTGIDFQVAPGEVLGLLGPNGAGKSTTIGMLTTTIKPTSGSARLAGFDVAQEPIAARLVSSVVFQDSVVDKTLTGRRNLELHARLWGIPAPYAARKITELAGVFGLAEVMSRPAGSYSGGQRRRLEIARALVSEPRVLFLDEPTVGLDTRIRYELLDLISGLRSRTGMTTVLTTHYLDEAERLCDRVAVMHRGTIVALDRPGTLLASLGAELIELRVADNPDGALAALRTRGLAAGDAFAVGSTLTVPLRGHSASDTLTALAGLGIRAEAVTTRRPTLDDIYLQLTGSRLAA
jgi:ABC-2 type transport system ATP-binding protein